MPQNLWLQAKLYWHRIGFEEIEGEIHKLEERLQHIGILESRRLKRLEDATQRREQAANHPKEWNKLNLDVEAIENETSPYGSNAAAHISAKLMKLYAKRERKRQAIQHLEALRPQRSRQEQFTA